MLAWGRLRGAVVVLDHLEPLTTLDAFAARMGDGGTWTGGFDLPFGLPRELVAQLGWPQQWEACMRHYAALDRASIRATFAAFCDARPAGAKFAHRACDVPAGSSPSMKWVNPPVAYMLHAGVTRLLDAGLVLPGLCPLNWAHLLKEALQRVALEAYPGLLAREILGRRSYKSDDVAKQTPDRLIARKDLLAALETGQTRLNLRLKLTAAQHDALVADGSGDTLDAVLCMVQAAWGQLRREAGDIWYGLPPDLDPLEGWIVSV
ncbi:MAG: DUF429 domain-containing protein [Rhodoferax sp.]